MFEKRASAFWYIREDRLRVHARRPDARHNPTMPERYDPHVWLWADNPAGMFARFHPAVSCPTYGGLPLAQAVNR
jgi:hypothetical protein